MVSKVSSSTPHVIEVMKGLLERTQALRRCCPFNSCPLWPKMRAHPLFFQFCVFISCAYRSTVDSDTGRLRLFFVSNHRAASCGVTITLFLVYIDLHPSRSLDIDTLRQSLRSCQGFTLRVYIRRRESHLGCAS